MPNNVSNKLTINATLQKRLDIQEFMKGKYDDGEINPFDFNRLIPMPEELRDIQTGATWIKGKQYRRWRKTEKGYVGIDDEEAAALSAKYGAPDWYEWAIANWGTKWNAYGPPTSSMGKAVLYFEFDTAWGTPKPIIQALADKFGVAVKVRVGGEIDRKHTYMVTPKATEVTPKGNDE